MKVTMSGLIKQAARAAAITGAAGIAAMACAGTAQAEVEPGSPIGHFEIVRFDVEGNTLLPGTTVEQLLAPYTGKERDFGSVQMALEALEGAYRQKGYSIVRVVLPEQELNHGVVHLRVIESKIGKVTVQGNQHFDDANIRRSLPALQEGQAPNLAMIGASLRTANDDPAKKTTLQLQTGASDGEINALLEVVDEKPWSAGVAVDNTGDENTGRNHLTVLYQNANIGGLDHVLSMQYTTSFANPSDVNIFSAGYHIPLYSLGDSLDFYGSYSNVNSGIVTAGVFDLAISGKGTVVGGRYNHNLLKVGDYDSRLIAGLDYKAFKNDISLQGTQLGNDVTVHPLSLTYAGTYATTANTFNFSLSAIRNLPGGSNGGSAEFSAARVDATENYSLLRFNANYARVLPKDWQLRFALNGQITDAALVQGEQFGAGGANSVRGFAEREIAADQGRSANFELYTPNLGSGSTQWRLLGFYDNGYVWRNDVQPGEIADQSISSTGLGFRLTAAQYLVMQADLAHVLNGTDFSPKGSNRVHFRVVMTY